MKQFIQNSEILFGDSEVLYRIEKTPIPSRFIMMQHKRNSDIHLIDENRNIIASFQKKPFCVHKYLIDCDDRGKILSIYDGENGNCLFNHCAMPMEMKMIRHPCVHPRIDDTKSMNLYETDFHFLMYRCIDGLEGSEKLILLNLSNENWTEIVSDSVYIDWKTGKRYFINPEYRFIDENFDIAEIYAPKPKILSENYLVRFIYDGNFYYVNEMHDEKSNRISYSVLKNGEIHQSASFNGDERCLFYGTMFCDGFIAVYAHGKYEKIKP